MFQIGLPQVDDNALSAPRGVGPEVFGSKQHVRLSFASSLELIREGMDRIEDALSALAAA